MTIQYKNTNIQYIASDLDGTLLFGEGHKLDDETYDLISRCVDEGIVFIIASGRTYPNELTVMEPIKDKVSYIASSGTMAVHNGETIVYYTIDEESAHKIFEISESMDNCHTFACTPSGNYTNSTYPPFFNHLTENVKIVLNEVDSLFDIKEPIEKISSFEENGAQNIVHILREACPKLNVVTSGPQWIDYLLKDVNKGTTLKVLLDKLGIDPKNGIAFGDQENDIEMIQTAGIGYVMKTGVPKAKEAADYIIDSPKEILKEILEQK